MATGKKRWPKPGDRLGHMSRKHGRIIAEVISVDRNVGSVVVSIDGEIYQSLSAAAKAVCGQAANGWVYWGLKSLETHPYRRKPGG